jgi:excisionase family DNA binding protein
LDDYLTVDEAARALRITYPAMISRLRRGKIPFIKKGWITYIHKDDVAAAQRRADGHAITPNNMETPAR